MNNNDVIKLVLILLFTIGISITVGYFIGKNKEKPIMEIPIEKTRVDTLYITNEVIKYKVKKLDSIKYDTIQKIYILDDSTTVKLFYKLCSE